MEPKDSNENLAWLSAAMTQSHTEGEAIVRFVRQVQP